MKIKKKKLVIDGLSDTEFEDFQKRESEKDSDFKILGASSSLNGWQVIIEQQIKEENG